jgi:SAM-dependent methyltransferase
VRTVNSRRDRREEEETGEATLPPLSARHPSLVPFLEACAEESNEQLANQRGRRSPAESRAIEQHVVAQLAPGRDDDLLELGCGTGLLARACAGRVRRLVAADVAWGLLCRARDNLREHANVRLVRADAAHLPFADGSFDKVLFFNVIGYCTRLEVVTILRELKRVCRPGGTILVGDISDPRRELMMTVLYGGWGAPSGVLRYFFRRLTGTRRLGWLLHEEIIAMAESVGLHARIIAQGPGMAFRRWRYDCLLTVSATPDPPAPSPRRS